MSTMQGMQYPVFEQNQTLSHTDLNSLFDYLNNQNILMRANLVGIGIVSGLNVSHIQETNKIKISKGCGITSDGHLIFIEKDYEFGYDRKITENELGCSSFLKNKPVELIKLRIIEAGSGEIDKDIYNNNTVIICYELRKEKIFCCSKEDDGSKKKASIFILLVPNSNLAESSGSTLSSPTVSLTVAAKLPRLVDLSISIEENIVSISDAIKNAYILWGNKLGNSIKSSIDKLDEVKSNANKTQIHYDFISDLIEAYEEFRQCGEKVLLKDRLSVERFSCHLILNGDYRHNFYPATAKNDYIELRWLWERLVTMIEYFNPNTVAPEIRLAPSVYGAVSLSQKAVPYYYNNVINNQPPAKRISYDVWTGRKNDERGIGYWCEDAQKKYYGYYHQESWKNYDLERYNFVRIEGHIGVGYDSAKRDIETGIGLYQLPIEIIELPSNSIETESHCISLYQKRAFGLLKLDFTVPTLVKNLYKNIHDLLVVKNIAEFLATDVADNDLRTKANKVIQLAKAVNDSAKVVKDLITGDINAAENAAENARASVTQAVKAFQEKLIDLNDALKVPTINDTWKEKIIDKRDKAAAMTTDVDIAMNAISARKKMQDKKYSDLERYLTEEYVEIRDSYEAIALAMLFKTTEDDYKKNSSFLQWLDATYTKYQQCKEFSSFVEFKKKHPRIQHKSGVPIGGTFILVYNDENKVIADFCLPYRVTQPD